MNSVKSNTSAKLNDFKGGTNKLVEKVGEYNGLIKN